MQFAFLVVAVIFFAAGAFNDFFGPQPPSRWHASYGVGLAFFAASFAVH